MTPPATRRTWGEQWRAALGRWWQLELALIAVLLFVTGVALPLADPDLPIHLATGEWIAKHHAVPFTEPFAWTRPGEPFQAYSWAIETLYWILISRFGPAGLNVLQGLIYVSLATVVVLLGRAAGWNPWTTILMAAGNLLIALGATPYVRPQSVLLIMLPLIWALVYHALNTNRLWLTLVGLVTASAVVANTHLLFPLTAAPCVLLLTIPPPDRKRIFLVPAAIALGWMLSPYSLHWWAVFTLNFAPNALFGPPTPIEEYKPGYLLLFTNGGSLFLAIGFTILPWIAARRMDARANTLFGLLWLAGLLMFALAVRSIVVWWLMIIPVVALVVELMKEPSLPVVRTAQRAIVPAIFVVVAMAALETRLDPALQAGDISSRFVPSTNARSMEPIAKWLDCYVRPEVGGRLVTIFNYGGYVPWRLPYLSESIDGRVIFADSVSRPESYANTVKGKPMLPPWRTADLAIFPVVLTVASVLDTATGWHKVAITNTVDGPSRIIGVWVTDRWWQRAGRIPLPRSVTPLMHVSEPRRATCADLTPHPVSAR
jgi:hypothetical protein